MAALQAVIFNIRREIYQWLVDKHKLSADQYQYLPWDRYLIGTVGLFVVATIFTLLTLMAARRYQFYAGLLKKHSELKIPSYQPSVFARILVCSMYFVFPLLDIAIRIYIRVHFEVGLHQ